MIDPIFPTSKPFYKFGNQCVNDCKDIKTVAVNNQFLFVSFIAKNEIIKQSNYKSVLLDPSNFNIINAEVFDTASSLFNCEWILDEEGTSNANGIEISFSDPLCTPLTQKINDTVTNTISCKVEFTNPSLCFEFDKKYVFNLRIFENNLEVTHTYTFCTNDYPVLQNIETIPNEGYLSSSKYVFRCGQCPDSNTPTYELLYEISYYQGNTPIDSTSPPIETILSDYSTIREASNFFDEAIIPEGEYTVVCRCKDKMEAEIFVSKTIFLLNESTGFK